MKTLAGTYVPPSACLHIQQCPPSMVSARLVGGLFFVFFFWLFRAAAANG